MNFALRFLFVLWILISTGYAGMAQMPGDGLMMYKGEFCSMLQYQHLDWSQYWEGSRLRDNQNIGTFTRQSVMWMSNYGWSDRLNVMAALPWVHTGSSASYLSGQSGLQDVSLWVKGKLWEKQRGSHTWRGMLTAGGSVPVSRYAVDFMPFSIGFHNVSASIRGIVHYQHERWGYSTLQAGYTRQGRAHLDRNAYIYNHQLYYGNTVFVPDMADMTFRLGQLRNRWQAEIFADMSYALQGDDIRYNEAPFLTNKTARCAVGLWGKYWWGPFAVSAGGDYVISGRNMGKSQTWQVALFYLFNI